MTINETAIPLPSTESKRASIKSMLRYMRLPEMLKSLEADWGNPNSDLQAFDDRILDVISSEYNARQGKKLARFIKAAHFKIPGADLSNMITDCNRVVDMEVLAQLKSCKWVDDRRNLIITGPCGCGKTWIGNALGVKACELFKQVKYYPCSQLLLRLESYSPEVYIQQLAELTNIDLLILDDIGLQRYDLDSCRIFFEILDARYKSGSIMMISQLPVKNWHDLFIDKTFANSILSRMIENSFRLDITGEDLRVRS